MLEALLILAIVVGVQLYQSRGLPDGVAPPLVGQRSDGATVDLGQKLGASDTADAAAGAAENSSLVVFWAEWCPVCKAEEGNIASVAADWPVYSVAMQSGDAAAVSRHLRQRGIALPALVDADGRHAENWRVRGVPTHFILDPAGKVRFRVVGYATTWGLKARLWWAQRFPA